MLLRSLTLQATSRSLEKQYAEYMVDRLSFVIAPEIVYSPIKHSAMEKELLKKRALLQNLRSENSPQHEVFQKAGKSCERFG